MECPTSINSSAATTAAAESTASFIFSSNTIYAAVLLFISYLAVQNFRSWSRLRHIPGPFLAQFSIIWLVRRSWLGNLWEDMGHLCEEHGPIIRIGPNEIAVGDPESLRQIWGARSKWTRSDWYSSTKLDPQIDNLLSTRNEKAHAELRAKMAAGYSGKENISLESDIDEILGKLIDLINRKYISKGTDYKRLDFARISSFFTIDVISKVAFGDEFGYLDNDEDVHGWVSTLNSMLPYIMMLGIIPGLAQVMNWSVVKRFMPHETDATGMGRVIGVAKEVAAKRFGPEKEVHRDMLGSFIRHGLTEEQAASESLLQILAGSDTTATGLRATFLYLLTSPKSLHKLLHELRTAVQTGRISSPVTDAEARSLPYLQACIKEGLRIFPPATGLIMKCPPPGGATFLGKFIPEGTKVGYVAWSIFRSKEVYGLDANMFRPERWLEADGPTLERMERSADMLFSPGKWMCLGKNVAMLELNKYFVEVLRNFDIAIEDPTRPWKSYNAAIYLQSEMWVRVSKRNWDDL